MPEYDFSETLPVGCERLTGQSSLPMGPVTRLADGGLGFTVPASADGAKAYTLLRNGIGVSYASVVTLRHTPGGLLRNGEPLRTVDRVRSGDRLEIRLPEPEPQSFAPYDGGQTASVLFRDDWVTVCEKPPFMPVHPAHTHQTDTLANVIGELFPGEAFRAVGRLDADTSGLMLLARDGYTAAWLPDRVEKRYLAVTCGCPPEEEGTVDVPLLPLAETGEGGRFSPEGQPARTRYRVLERKNGLALVECRLETGRTHQIRAHMAWLGCPLAGDARYGGDTALLDRHALHCTLLAFPEPDGSRQIFLSPPPFLEQPGFSPFTELRERLLAGISL